eukprot:gene11411-7915_t
MAAAPAHLYACRHGQNEDNVEGILNGHRDRPLTDLGRAQAKATAKRISEGDVKFSAIYSSPLCRALETAEEIALAVGLKVEVHPKLIERDFGILSGKRMEEKPKYATEFFQGDEILYFLAGEGVESFESCYQRAKDVMDDISQRHPGENVLLVCHGDIMMMMRAVKRGITWKEGLALKYIGNADVLDLDKETETTAA